MKILYLTCTPHIVHNQFARSIGAEKQIVPFIKIVKLANNHNFYRKIYPLLAALASFFMKFDADILFVEGAAVLFFYLF
ncbi:MAG: hypothetical protein K9N40_09940 [Candidatus Cloacimonetes bacterium]|nr:hypothetical protein [Candidatus Cloacimonadota bacterium]